MYFYSTRNKERVSAHRAILYSVPEKGGLYIPESLPVVSKEEMETMLGFSYPERATEILAKFLDFDKEFISSVCEKAYEKFEGDDPNPLVRIDENRYILELYHGLSCAYEDFSMSLLPEFMKKAREMEKSDEKIFLVMATSGDAGESAIEYFKNDPDFRLALVYPEEYLSRLGRLQICTERAKNVYACGLYGTFDDCAKEVKAFENISTREALKEKGYILSSASSQNIGRILPEIVPYFSAYLDLVSSNQIKMGSEVDFAVPCGNLCNIVAGFYAKKMGLPIRKLIYGTNRNRALFGLLQSGEGEYKENFRHTMSLNMDVQQPTNFERILIELNERDTVKTCSQMKELESGGRIAFTDQAKMNFLKHFYCSYAGEDDTVEAVYEVFEEYGYAMDTHTGVAVAVAQKYLDKLEKKDELPLIVTAVANPYKFPQDVLYALTGNDVKDSYKGVKRLNLLTAMKPPKYLLSVRYLPIRFDDAFKKDQLEKAIMDFADGKIKPVPKAE